MSESKITRSVDINMGGKDRKLKFTIGALEQLEASLPGHNVAELMTRNNWSVGELITTTWVGLKYYDKKLTRDEAKGMVGEYLAETEQGDLWSRLVAALGLSGLFGRDVSKFQDIITALDGNSEENPTEAENTAE